MSKCLGVIWNCDYVLKWNVKSNKICELNFFSYLLKNDEHKKCDILKQL